MMQGLQTRRTVGSSAHVAGKVIFYAGCLGAGGVLLFQSAEWLQDGRWSSLPLMDSMSWLALHSVDTPTALAFMNWIDRPSSWYGLHYLMAIMPTSLTLAIIGFLGSLISDWGIVTRRRAQERMRDAVLESSHRRDSGNRPSSHLDADFRDSGVHGFSSPISQYIGAVLAPVEQDIMRWLAINDADQHANSLDLITRHLEYPPAEIKHGVAKLSGQGFIASSGGHLQLSERGRSYCIEEGWTVSVRRAG